MSGKRLISVLAAAILTIAVASIGFIVVAGRPLKFDAFKWKEGNSRVRWRIAKDIATIRSEIVGLSPSEIEALLGKPDAVIDVVYPPPERVYFYMLSPPLDPAFWNLKVCFNTGVATNVFVSD